MYDGISHSETLAAEFLLPDHVGGQSLRVLFPLPMVLYLRFDVPLVEVSAVQQALHNYLLHVVGQAVELFFFQDVENGLSGGAHNCEFGVDTGVEEYGVLALFFLLFAAEEALASQKVAFPDLLEHDFVVILKLVVYQLFPTINELLHFIRLFHRVVKGFVDGIVLLLLVSAFSSGLEVYRLFHYIEMLYVSFRAIHVD